MATVSVTRTYLEQREPSQLVDGSAAPRGAHIEPVVDCPPSFYRWLYATVGGPWHWRDRLTWDDPTIRAHLTQLSVLLRVLYVAGVPAGYYELYRHADGSIEIKYIGLLPERIGRGLGRYLVAEATREAWALGANRVLLDTCTLDGPTALPNYLKRGFVPYKTAAYTVELPDA